MTMDNTLRLFLVGNDPLARAGLAMLLAEQSNCLVVGQASSTDFATLATGELAETAPNVVVWDLGWEPVASQTAVFPLPDPSDLPIPTIALLADPADAPLVWGSGVYGLLNRQLASDKLLAAAQAVANGLRVFAPDLLPTLLAAPLDDSETAVDLTPREADVLQLLAEGLTNKAIAQQLDISSHTVKFHVNAIMSKLHAQSRTEAVVQATRQGLLLL